MPKSKKAAVGTCIQLTDTTWRLQVSAGSDANGKRLRPSKTVEAKDERQARKMLAEFVNSVEKGTYIEPSKMSFHEFSIKWLKDYALKQLAPKTYHRYKEMIDTRMVPGIGHHKLEKLTPLHLMQFYNFISEPHKYIVTDKEGKQQRKDSPGLSDRTILHHHRLIHTMLQHAVQWQMVISNAASRVDPPKVQKKEARHYTEEQAQLLITALDDEPIEFRVIVLLTLFAGMREGELMGLEWKDINIDKGTVEVNRSSQYIPGQGTFEKDPKNESSQRIVSIPPFIIELLKQHKAAQNGERMKKANIWVKSDRLFTQWNGKPMHPQTPTKWFPQFIIRYNTKIMNDESISENDKEKYFLPKLNFHGLRHTNATLLIAQGVNIKTISSRLGHSNVGTTLNIYSHSLRTADVDAAGRLESALIPKPKGDSGIGHA